MVHDSPDSVRHMNGAERQMRYPSSRLIKLLKKMRPADTRTDVVTIDVRVRTPEELKHDILEILRDFGSVSMKELTDHLGYSRNASNVYAAIRDMVG